MSFASLRESPLRSLCAGDPEEHPTAEWAGGEDTDTQHRFTDLLARTVERSYPDLRWHDSRLHVHFRASSDLKPGPPGLKRSSSIVRVSPLRSRSIAMKSSCDFYRCHASSSAHDRSVTTGGPACRAGALARGAGRESRGLAQDDLLLRGGQAYAHGAALGAAGRGPRVRSGRAHWGSARPGDACRSEVRRRAHVGEDC